MNHSLTSVQKNQVIKEMIRLVDESRADFLAVNKEELEAYTGSDTSMYDRLKMNDAKVDGMITSLQTVLEKEDPVGQVRYQFENPKGLKVENRTAPFGTILIIYESRPDVTVEAAVIAFKSGNKIILKGGKESKKSNLVLMNCWHQALENTGLSKDWIQYLDLPRAEVQEFLKSPDNKFDLVVPRGGEKLIAFVKEHSGAPVLVSGRGNNFLFINKDAQIEMVMDIITNAKFDKISACNALDKVLIHKDHPNKTGFLNELKTLFDKENAELIIDQEAAVSDAIWKEEFLAKKMVIGEVNTSIEAIEMINTHSGGHSAIIITELDADVEFFMQNTDVAAVYHNASSRFTDGGQFGLGAELAISTDKIHHRGPLGLEHLISNKWFVFGKGHIRK